MSKTLGFTLRLPQMDSFYIKDYAICSNLSIYNCTWIPCISSENMDLVPKNELNYIGP